jgi:homoserine/homoserine lactone efflux protein
MLKPLPVQNPDWDVLECVRRHGVKPKIIVFCCSHPSVCGRLHADISTIVNLEGTFLILAALNVMVWAVLAGTLRARFKQAASRKMIHRIGDSFLICAGCFTALIRQVE